MERNNDHRNHDWKDNLLHYFLPQSEIVLLTLPPHAYRITLSARTSTFGGIVRPICLAVLRLMMNSNLIGCSTGRSAGFVPLRILSTYQAPLWPLRYLSGLYETKASTDCSAEQPHAGSFF